MIIQEISSYGESCNFCVRSNNDYKTVIKFHGSTFLSCIICEQCLNELKSVNFEK